MILKITNWSFLLLVFSLPFVNLAYLTVMGQKVLISEFLFLITSALFTLSLIFRKQKFVWSSFYLPLGFYLFALTLSTAFSDMPQKSAVKLIGEFYLIGLAILTFNLVSSIKELKRTVLVWVAATVVVSFVSLITFFLFYLDRSNILLSLTLSHYGTLPVGNYPRIQSLFLNPNMFCHYLSIGWAFLLLSFSLSWLRGFIFYVALGALGFASALTISPGIGGIFLCVGFWLWFHFDKMKSYKSARLALAIGSFGALLFFFSTIGYPAQSDSEPNGVNIGITEIKPSIRTLAWKKAFLTFGTHPFFGKGLDADVAPTSFKLPSGKGVYITDAHQMWLNVMGQAGLLGLAGLLLICFWFFGGSPPLLFKTRLDTIRTCLAIAFISAFVYQGLFGSYENARHLWVLIGLFACFISSTKMKIVRSAGD